MECGGGKLCDFFRPTLSKTTSGGKQGVAHDRCAKLTDEKGDKGVADLAGSPRHRHNELPLIGSMRRHVARTKNARRQSKPEYRLDKSTVLYDACERTPHFRPFQSKGLNPLSSEALGCLVSFL